MKLKIGTRVSFRGERGSNGKPVCVREDGPDTFEATIANYPYGLCYGLEYDDGQPAGLPFHDFQLTVVS